MKDKRSTELRLWRLILLIHTIVFLLGWAVGTHLASVAYSYSATFAAIVLLFFWSLTYGADIAAYAYVRGKNASREDERQAYRDGYHDAVREFMNPDRAYDARRLTLDEDGELVEWDGKQKRG